MSLRVLVSATAAVIGLAATSLSLAGEAPSPAAVAAVADAARPQADRDRDADRKPAELAAFAGISSGSKVAEVSPGGGYFTRVFSKTVGAKGVVYGLAPPPRGTAPRAIDTIAADPQYSNVKVLAMDAKLPEQVDVVWTSLNYHDFHNRPSADLMPFNKHAFDSLKPGGSYIVIDHAAEKGSGKRDTNTLHRIDPDLVKSEVVAAGFEFVRESPLLANPADDRTKTMGAVPRGKTDQFVYMFRRPK